MGKDEMGIIVVDGDGRVEVWNSALFDAIPRIWADPE